MTSDISNKQEAIRGVLFYRAACPAPTLTMGCKWTAAMTIVLGLVVGIFGFLTDLGSFGVCFGYGAAGGFVLGILSFLIAWNKMKERNRLATIEERTLISQWRITEEELEVARKISPYDVRIATSLRPERA